MHLPPFEGPRRKVKRANHNIEEFAKVVNEFFHNPRTMLPRVGILPDGTRRYQFLTPQVLPEALPLIIGETIHNLRSALDILASDVVRLSNKSTNRVHFPFAESEDGLTKGKDCQIKNKNFHRAHPEAQKLLISLRPYIGGNALLRGLHDLNNMDKHQLIVPILNSVKIDELCYFGTTTTDFVVKKGFHVDIPPGAENPGISMKLSPSLRLPIGVPLCEGEVLDTLKRLSELVDTIIEQFAALTCWSESETHGVPVSEDRTI